MASETVPAQKEQLDAWHTHSAKEGLPQVERGGKVNTAKIFVAGVISVVIIVVTTIATAIYFSHHATELRRERIETTALSAEYVQYRQHTRQVMADFSWANPGPGIAVERVLIPLDQAKQRVIEKYGALSPPPQAGVRSGGEGSGY